MASRRTSRRLSDRRRRRPQHGAQAVRHRVRWLHLAGALHRAHHAVRFRGQPRLLLSQLFRRPGRVVQLLQGLGRRPARPVARPCRRRRSSSRRSPRRRRLLLRLPFLRRRRRRRRPRSPRPWCRPRRLASRAPRRPRRLPPSSSRHRRPPRSRWAASRASTGRCRAAIAPPPRGRPTASSPSESLAEVPVRPDRRQARRDPRRARVRRPRARRADRLVGRSARQGARRSTTTTTSCRRAAARAPARGHRDRLAARDRRRGRGGLLLRAAGPEARTRRTASRARDAGAAVAAADAGPPVVTPLVDAAHAPDAGGSADRRARRARVRRRLAPARRGRGARRQGRSGARRPCARGSTPTLAQDEPIART